MSNRRGGLGVRKALSERIASSTAYRLVGVPAGSLVAECLDKYGRWELGHRQGVILRNSVNMVTVQWQGDDEFTIYNAGDARYEVDRGRWRIQLPSPRSPLDALTSSSGGESIMPSPQPGASPRKREEVMAVKLTTDQIDKMTLPQLRKEAEKIALEHKGLRKAELIEKLKHYHSDIEDDELEDEVDDEELDDELEDDEAPESDDEDDELDDDEEPAKPSTPEPSGETYTAKQVATRIGTDAKTLRKFFRSPASTVEAVGQGGRYEFAKEDLPKIKAEFEKWNSAKPTRTPKAPGEKKTTGRREAPASAIEEVDEELDIEDDEEEPTSTDLDELDEDLELDDELDDDELDD